MFEPKPTKDGSFTFFSEEFQEAFHSDFGAVQEAYGKFVIPCQLIEQATNQTENNSQLKLLDVCYGLGYNTAEALSAIWQVNPQCQVELIALEANREVPDRAIAYQLIDRWQQPIPQLLKQLVKTTEFRTSQLKAQLLIGDARQTIQTVLKTGFKADAIFLDPFSPPKCPQLWTVEFLGLLAQCLQPQGRLSTYSCAASVRVALQLAGLKIGATENIGRRSPGTVASFLADLPPLSLQELEHLATRAAIPYRDRTLQDLAATIRHRREKEQQESCLEPTSHWKKRWLRSAKQARTRSRHSRGASRSPLSDSIE